MRVFAYTLFFITLSTSALAKNPSYRGYSVRALGMGNAFTAIADSHDAIYYNVAGLNKIQGLHITFLDPYIGVNDVSDIVDTVSDLDDAAGDEFVNLIRAIYGKNIWAGFGAKVGVTTKNFSLHYYDQAELNAYMTNPAFPTLEFTFKNDQGVQLGVAKEVMPNLAVGLGLRSIRRTGGSYDINMDVLEDLDGEAIEDEVLRKGTAYGMDFGLMYSKEGYSLGFAWHNVGDLSFRGNDNKLPKSEKSYMSIGVASHIDLGLATLTPALDYKFLDKNDISFERKIDLGLELDLPLLTLRGGLHQGYLTYGFSVDLVFLQIEAASYAEELGEYSGQMEDRRYIAQFKIEFGMDADFNFFRMDKKSHPSLKQRR